MNLPTLALGMGGLRAIGDVTAGIGGMRAAGYNARVARMQAEAAQETGESEAAAIREKGLTVIGRQRAAAAASGVDVGTGSPLRAVMDTIDQSYAAASEARLKGEYQAWGLEAEAAQQKWMGRQTLLSGLVGGAGATMRGIGTYGLLKSKAPLTYNPFSG